MLHVHQKGRRMHQKTHFETQKVKKYGESQTPLQYGEGVPLLILYTYTPCDSIFIPRPREVLIHPCYKALEAHSSADHVTAF